MDGQTLTRADIPLPGGAEAVSNVGGLSYYRHSDWLGSARLSSSPSQTLDAAAAYAPFGEEETGAAAGYRDFTGKTQDIAHGQAGTDPNGSYDFPAREYSPTQSRWWSPDPAALAAVDPGDPASWNRYAYGCDPLGTTDPTGMASPCTIGVSVSQLGRLPNVSLSAVEGRINQIFAATAASNGGLTQIAFFDGGDARFGLQELWANLKHCATCAQPWLGVYYLGTGGPAESFVGTQQIWGEGWAGSDQPGTAPLDLAALAGAIAAHELIHEVTGITDTQYGGQNLMGIDTAPASAALAIYNDLVSATPAGYSKLNQAEANALYSACLNAKLKPPGSGGTTAGPTGGGGGAAIDPFEVNPWFWFIGVLNANAFLPNCPHGDCK